MADLKPGKPRRIWRVLFGVSLALNVAVVGAVLGNGLRDAPGAAGPRGFDFALGPIGQALSKQDRREIGANLRRHPDLQGQGRNAGRQLVSDFTTVLRAEPFSEDALQVVLAQATSRASAVQNAARDTLIAQIATMSDAERSALADRIEANRRRRK